MQKHRFAWVTAMILVAILGAVALTSRAETGSRARRHFEPVVGTVQAESAQITLTSDGSQESNRAFEFIQQVLRDEKCQLGIEVRIAGDGVLEPRIVVERYYVLPPTLPPVP